MEFLLECIGFPPGLDADELVARVREEGEPVAWRGDPEDHLRLPIGGGLELRIDREPGGTSWCLLPHYRVPYRLRLGVESIQRVEGSPFDALLTGWASPPSPDDLDPAVGRGAPGYYRLATWLTDARRLPRQVRAGKVLAISVAGFAVDVTYVGPNSGASHPGILERPHGAYVAPLSGSDKPGGCSDVSLRVKEIHTLRNRLTGREVELCVCDAPERPVLVFVSPWQLQQDGLPGPRPGWRIEGTFLFTGRVAGGLEGPRSRVRRSFG